MSSVSPDFIQILNDTVLDFMTIIGKYTRENSQFLLYDMITRAGIASNKHIAADIIHKSVVIPYGGYIKDENDEFLLQQRFEGVDNSLINSIKDIWVELNDQDKAEIWKYMKVLLALCNKIHDDRERLEKMKDKMNKKNE